MKIKMHLPFLLCLVIALTTAAPGRYQQQYQFQRASSSYQNNELQHKNEEAGAYAKHGDTESSSPPHEQSAYMQQEYHKPGEDQTQVAVNSFLDDLRQDQQGHVGQIGALGLGQHGGNSQHYFEQSSSRYEASSSQVSHGLGQRRPWHRNKPTTQGATAGKLEEIEDNTDFARYQDHGFGKEYLDNTEGHHFSSQGHGRTNTQIYSQGRPTTQIPTNTVRHYSGRTPVIGVPRDLVSSSTNHHGSHSTYPQTEFGGQEQEDLTQQTQDIFGKDSQEDLTQQTQDGFGKFEFGSQHKDEDLTQQTQDGFSKFDFGQQEEDLTQQTQDGFGKFEIGSQHGQTSQSGLGKVEIGTNQHRNPSETSTGFGKLDIGSTQQQHTSQNGLGRVETSTHQQRNPTQTYIGYGYLGTRNNTSQTGLGRVETGTTNQRYPSQIGLSTIGISTNQQRYPSQIGLATIETGPNNQRYPTQTQSGYDNIGTGSTQQHTSQIGLSSIGTGTNQQRNPTQTYTGYGYLGTGSTQQHTSETGLSTVETGSTQQRYPSQIGLATIGTGTNHPRYPTQPQSGIGNLGSGSTQQPHTSQLGHGTNSPTRTPTYTGYGGLNTGTLAPPLHHQPSRGQKPHPELTQTQSGMGKLEFGSQKHDDINQMTQQSQHGFDEDLTQQTQDEFSKFEFGGQEHEDMTQQTQDGFGKLEIRHQQHGHMNQHTTQQSQSNLGFGSQHTQHGKLEFGGQEHMTQQTQNGFGKLEIGQEHQDMSQQTQTGFGKLEIGNQHRGDLSEEHQEDLTQQTQDGFGKLDFGHHDISQQHMTQQNHKESGKLEYGNQHQEDLTQQTQHGFGKLEFGQHEDMSQQHMTQQSQNEFGKLEFGAQHQDDLTQQTQDGFGKLEISGHDDLSQQHSSGKLEIGQHKLDTQEKEIGGTAHGNLNINAGRGVKGGARRQYGSSFSSSSSYAQQHAASSSYNHQTGYAHSGVYHSPIKPVYEEISEENTKDMKAVEEIEQYAQKLHDVSLQAKNPIDLTQEKEKMINSDHELENSRGILEKNKHEHEEIIEPTEATTTKKPGFWKRLGGSITTTYETAKEKTITLAEKVKHNIG